MSSRFRWTVLVATVVLGLAALWHGARLSRSAAGDDSGWSEANGWIHLDRERREIKVDRRVVDAYNSAGFDVFGTLHDAQPPRNVVVSPANLGLTLTMLLGGATGDTAERLRRLLHAEHLSLPRIDGGASALVQRLASVHPEARATFAQALWVQGYELHPAFEKRARRSYDAMVAPYRPGDVERWLAAQTRCKTSEPPLPAVADRALVLTSAVRFDGVWEHTFDRDLTQPAPFETAAGVVSVPMMHQTYTSTDYFADDQVQVVALTYGTQAFGEGLQMIIALPRRRDGLPGLVAKLDDQTWQLWTDGLAPCQGTLALPRFVAQSVDDLGPALSALGFPVGDDAPTFSRAVKDGSPWVQLASQSSVIDVHERGTEAASGARMILVECEQHSDVPFSMTVDHPFLFAIWDNKSGAILFLGAIANPAAPAA